MTPPNFGWNFKRIYQMVVVQIWSINLDNHFPENKDQAT